jgi:hypothetical protein
MDLWTVFHPTSRMGHHIQRTTDRIDDGRRLNSTTSYLRSKISTEKNLSVVSVDRINGVA